MMRRLIATAVSLAALLSLGSCSLLPGGGSGGDMEITTFLPDTAGLFVGNDVGVLGVPVGKIKSIQPVGDTVKVVLTVDGDVDVPADVGAIVTARSVATDRYLELAPVYTTGEKMADGGEIPLERTATPIDFDTVLSTLSQFSKDIGGNKETAGAVRKFLKVGAETFQGNGKKMNASIVALGDAVEAVSGQRDNILGTLGSLDVLTQALAANEDTIHKFTGTVATATKLLADERGNLRKALTTLSTSITVVAEFANKHRKQITGSVNKLTSVIETILGSQQNLKKMIEVMPLALQNVKSATGADGISNARMSPVFLTPLGAELQAICQSLPANLCDTVALTPGTPLSELLGGLL
jgi:phospholipid/cholesterol/gamma-HCH transport system substrate-binding protein